MQLMLKDTLISRRSFRPHEVEEITGLSVAMQRVWRHRELLTPQPTDKRPGEGFGPWDVAHILVLLSLNGVAAQDLKVASEHASLCAGTVLWFAARHPEAWSYVGSPDEIAEMQKQLTHLDKSAPDNRMLNFLDAQRDHLKRYSVRLTDGIEWTDDLGTVFAGASQMAGVVIDHERMAEFLLKAMRGTLFFAKSSRTEEPGPHLGRVGERTVTKSVAGRHAAKRLAHAMASRQPDKAHR
jgi:hypothetical protein